MSSSGSMPAFDALRDRLADLPDDELCALVSEGDAPGTWGASGRAVIDGTDVFIKRIPITDVEVAHPYATSNLFRLPSYYSYGVGSAGFGVWRELAMHEKTSGLSKFLTLLHHRVMPRSAPPGRRPWDDGDYVRYWNGSKAVARFMAARDAATRELWIVLEHVPHMGWTWLLENQAAVDELLAQLFEQIAVLRSLGVVHFDAHLGNVVTDGNVFRLTDFGLVVASDFDLRPSERAFLHRHAHYDYGVVLGCLGLMLALALGEPPTSSRLGPYIDDIESLPVPYDQAFRAALTRYRHPILYMVDHLHLMQRPSKRLTYDDATFTSLLRDAGVHVH